MGLLSAGTVWVGVALALAASVACALLWNRVGSRPASRWSARVTLLALAEATTLLVAALLLNNRYDFYASWADLYGKPRFHSAATAAPVGDIVRTPKDGALLLQNFQHGHGTVLTTTIPGTASGIPTQPAMVYVPADYGNPALQGVRFPVVELLGGVPSTPQSWIHPMHLQHTLDDLIATHRSAAFIAVMPTMNVVHRRDTECADVVRGPHVDTYLSIDVHAAVMRQFRAIPDRSGWAVMGYSTGGYCALDLMMRHPSLYRAAVSLSGYDKPYLDSTTGPLFGGSRDVYNQFSPLWHAQHWKGPDVDALEFASSDDPLTARDAGELVKAAHPPMQVTARLLPHGGHTFGFWSALEPAAFGWLSERLSPALLPSSLPGTPPSSKPSKSTTGGGLKSGDTVSR